MTIIEFGDPATYSSNADTFRRTDRGQEVWEAFLRVGVSPSGKDALVIRAKALDEVTAITSLTDKVRSFMRIMETEANTAFLATVYADKDEKADAAREAIRKAFGLPDEPEDPDKGNDPGSQPS